jgi:hypothetical protein
LREKKQKKTAMKKTQNVGDNWATCTINLRWRTQIKKNKTKNEK